MTIEGVDKSTNPMPPYLAVNTTAGTASEMTRFCIITDLARHVKMAIVDWRVTPGIAVDDPRAHGWYAAGTDRCYRYGRSDPTLLRHMFPPSLPR